MHPRRYLFIALGLTSALLGGFVALNASLDPYGLAAATAAAESRGAADGERPGSFWRKAFAVREARPRTVILGTSRSEVAIDPHHPGFGPEDAPVLNLSLGAASIEQMRLLLIHAHETSRVRKAVIGLDLEAFLGGGRADFDAAGLKGNPDSEPELFTRLRIGLSRDALLAGLTRWITPAAAGPGPLERWNGQRGLIWITEYNNFYSRLPYLFPYWPPGTRWVADSRRAASMTAFRNLLDYARREGIELRMFISPVHARYLVWYQQVGWWPQFESFKRALVEVIDEEARSLPGRSAYELWDFSGFHAAASETVPRIGDLSTRMRWYLESSHYSPELGDLILDRVLGRPGSVASPLPDSRIDRATIERHLSAIVKQSQEYRLSQAGEVANVRQMVVYLRRMARK